MAAAVGDIAGSAYEGRTHRTKDYNAVKMFSSRAHFTDDTVLTFACAEAFLKNILVLRNAFEKTRKQMKANALSINALSDNLNFPMFAELTLKKT